MAWTTNPSLGGLISDLLALQIRAQRVKVLQSLERVRVQAKAAGVSVGELDTLKAKLLSYSVMEADRSLLYPEIPVVQSSGLSHLTVSSLKGTGV
jgi:hypothetical protein